YFYTLYNQFYPYVTYSFPHDALPIFDLAIFNASFHYSEDYHRTLGEVLCCLRRPGHLAIIDSPFYERPESGEEMVKQRRALFLRDRKSTRLNSSHLVISYAVFCLKKK